MPCLFSAHWGQGPVAETGHLALSLGTPGTQGVPRMHNPVLTWHGVILEAASGMVGECPPARAILTEMKQKLWGPREVRLVSYGQ